MSILSFAISPYALKEAAAESIGIEGRGAFYESTGVVRDMASEAT